MNCLVLACHPSTDSFAIALGNEIVERLTPRVDGAVSFIDLYRASFDPVLTSTELKQHWSFDAQTQRSITQLQNSDVIIIIHPVWWATMPALLVGWIQRVFKPEIAFRYQGEEFTQKSARGLFTRKQFLIAYLADNASSDISCQIVEQQWRYTLRFCAAQNILFEPIGELRTLTRKERRLAIERLFERAKSLFV